MSLHSAARSQPASPSAMEVPQDQWLQWVKIASQSDAAHARLSAFRRGELDVIESLRIFAGDFESAIADHGFANWRRTICDELTLMIARLDDLIESQVNEAIHHPKFQKLEATWRGLALVVKTVTAERSRSPAAILVKILNVSWKELHRDFERAVEFDSSQIFQKVYEQEFGIAGGIPFSVLIGDYEVRPRPTATSPIDDLSVLEHMAGVAAAAFCPFVCSASPAMFGVDSFRELETAHDLAAGFALNDFVKWRSFRRWEDARFVGLALPRILLRRPYELEDTQSMTFTEDVRVPDGSKYLWGNAAFAWACVLIRTFADSGWLADIRGTERNSETGGLVTGLPSVDFSTDRQGIARRSSTDIVITDRQEAELSRLGFLSLCQCHDSDYCAFYSSQSIQEPKVYDDPLATANANVSGMLQYMLCVSRFAHYLKVLAREEVGGSIEPAELQMKLDSWIKQYVTPDESARPESKAKRPLRSAEIEIIRDPGKPGSFQMIMRLLPHYQLDDLTAAINLKPTIVRGPAEA